MKRWFSRTTACLLVLAAFGCSSEEPPVPETKEEAQQAIQGLQQQMWRSQHEMVRESTQPQPPPTQGQ